MKPEYRFAQENTVSAAFIQRALAGWMEHLIARAQEQRRQQQEEADVAAPASSPPNEPITHR